MVYYGMTFITQCYLDKVGEKKPSKTSMRETNLENMEI